MAKQKEAWDKLSMQEKALLIKLSVDNGVSSLKLIRDTYNLYKEGGCLGHLFDDGGNTSQVVQGIRQRLAHNINPFNYEFPFLRTVGAVVFNRQENGRRNYDTSNIKDMQRLAAWSKYLDTPVDEITNLENYIVESKYQPSKYSNPNAVYYSYKPQEGQSLVDAYRATSGYFTMGLGEDAKGKYISLYDLWDLNPIDARSSSGDGSFGIGKPFEAYDRIYESDNPEEYQKAILDYEGALLLNGEKKYGDNVVAFKNGGHIGHWKDGTLEGESLELNYPNDVIRQGKQDILKKIVQSPVGAFTRFIDPTGILSIPDAYYDLKHLVETPTTQRTTADYIDATASVVGLFPFGNNISDFVKVKNWRQGLQLANKYVEHLPFKLVGVYPDMYLYNNQKSTGGPLYPFSFEKNPFLKTPAVRYDEGGLKHDASNPGGYTNTLLAKNSSILGWYDPTGGLNFINYVLSLNFGNMARGEENEYWKEYLGLPSAVPLMNSNANTEWDKKIEQEKIAKGELASDFYGTTPRMDYNILALADTLMLGEMVRNYEKYDLEYNLPSIKSLTEAYELAKTILNNPNKWTQVDGEIEVNNWPFNPNISESNPLGMLANFGMKWVPEENALYMHDTYDFPTRVHRLTDIPVRPREMKIRSRINFDPTKGSWLLRSPVNYNTNIPAKITK